MPHGEANRLKRIKPPKSIAEMQRSIQTVFGLPLSTSLKVSAVNKQDLFTIILCDIRSDLSFDVPANHFFKISCNHIFCKEQFELETDYDLQTFDAAEESLLCMVITPAAKRQPSGEHRQVFKEEVSEDHPQKQGGQEQEQEFEEGEEEEHEEEEEEEAFQGVAEHPIRASGEPDAEEGSVDYSDDTTSTFLPPVM